MVLFLITVQGPILADVYVDVATRHAIFYSCGCTADSNHRMKNLWQHIAECICTCKTASGMSLEPDEKREVKHFQFNMMILHYLVV